MTALVGESVHFGLVELDLLAAHAGVPLPFPLRVPVFGRIEGEREVLLAAAGHTLHVRGLADDTGPVGPAADLVRALRDHRGAVDLVLIGPDRALGVAALVHGGWATVLRQHLDDDSAPVRVHRVPDTALAEDLLALVPDVPGAGTFPLALPARAARAAADAIADVRDDAERERRLRDLVRADGGDPGVLDQLAGLLAVVASRGQLGATQRTDDGSVRTGAELSWLDGPRGRVRVSPPAHGWVSVNPLHRTALRGALDELTALARTAATTRRRP